LRAKSQSGCRLTVVPRAAPDNAASNAARQARLVQCSALNSTSLLDAGHVRAPVTARLPVCHSDALLLVLVGCTRVGTTAPKKAAVTESSLRITHSPRDVHLRTLWRRSVADSVFLKINRQIVLQTVRQSSCLHANK